MGKLSRQKGASFERRIANLFRETIFPDCHRTAPMQAGEVKRGYADLGGTPGFHFELGHGKRMDPVKKLEQAIAGSEVVQYNGAVEESFAHDLFPVAITQRDRGPTTVTMHMDDFIKIIGEWMDLSDALDEANRLLLPEKRSFLKRRPDGFQGLAAEAGAATPRNGAGERDGGGEREG